MAHFIGISGLIMNLIASLMIGYARIFRSKKTIKKESRTDTTKNVYEEKHRLIETRIAQIGADGVIVTWFRYSNLGPCSRMIVSVP